MCKINIRIKQHICKQLVIDVNIDLTSYYLYTSQKSYPYYVNRLKKLREQLFVDVEFIKPARLEHLRDEAMVTEQGDIRKFGEIKCYTLVVVLIYMKLTVAMDDLVHIFTIWIRKIENNARDKYEAYQIEQAEKINFLILSLYKMLLIIKNNLSLT